MCGRYVLTGVAEIAERYQIAQLTFDLAPRYNIAPGQENPVVVVDEGARQLELMKWGLVPSWSKTAKMEYPTFNARAEGIDTKSTFRGPLRQRRCLVPATGFYEWSGKGAKKQPYFIHLKEDALFSFAGLYDRCALPDGEVLHTYTIITTTPNAAVAPLHDRMAVILRPEDEEEWLDPTVTDAHQVMRLLAPYPAEALALYPVTSRVNSVHNEGPDLLAPLQVAQMTLGADAPGARAASK